MSCFGVGGGIIEADSPRHLGAKKREVGIDLGARKDQNDVVWAKPQTEKPACEAHAFAPDKWKQYSIGLLARLAIYCQEGLRTPGHDRTFERRKIRDVVMHYVSAKMGY